jgi:putative spermidine/putrescine transport system permease protein
MRLAPATATFLVIAFLVAPIVVVVLSAFSATGYMTFPPSGLSLRWFIAFFTDAGWLATLAVTLLLSLMAALASVVLGFAAAFVMTRRRLPGHSLVEFLILLPLVFPHAALAVAILAVVSTFGLVGTFAGILMAHVVITLPFAYRPISGSLSQLDIAHEEAALSLGATPWTTFRRVTLPLVAPGLVTALLFCFVISFDEATITLFLVGPEFTTLPIKIFSQLQDNANPLVAAVSTLLILFTTFIVVLVERVFGLELFVEPGRGAQTRRG